MVVYHYRLCGSIYDEEKEGVPASGLKVCPVCMVIADKLAKVEGGGAGVKAPDKEEERPVKKDRTRETCQDCSDSTGEAVACNSEYAKTQTDARYMDEIRKMAIKGQSITAAMRTQMPIPGWDDILFPGVQLNPIPLDEYASVRTETIIGRHTVRPMVLDRPVYISHMSFGALSRETKTVLPKGNAMAHTAMCSGESDILSEEKAMIYKCIFEYVPSRYSVTDENLKEADAIKIKIGQGTKPGIGGHLSEGKVTSETAATRNKPSGQDVISPPHFPDINTKEDSKALVNRLHLVSGGWPISIKIAAGRVKKDLEFCAYAGSGFITIDGRGGAAGASLKIIRDSTSVPTIYALYRARKYLNQTGCGAQLMITNDLRVFSDLVKALAIGADAVAIASTALMTAIYQQYRMCGAEICPVEAATQDEELRSHFKGDVAAQKVANFLRVSLEGIRTFVRITGHDNIHDMDADNLCTVNRETSELASIRHA